ncbi:unnamed protein product [Arabis nemorensis]|uniref:SHSP domain-containing protein n=1 Tax=Arabis nemorensis TaxID=586526 RepID=A0A565C3T7_9BRAS|nr:unnamed protein product [Arabis nemorensis]
MSRKMSSAITKPGSSRGNNPPPIPRNRFQKSGSESVYEVMDTKNACIFRVDMPGCPGSDLSYSVDSTNFHFFADEQDKPEYNYSGRKYGGTMMINPKAYNVKEAKAKLANGVLWITVPKIPGKNATTDVTEKMLYCKITRDDFA